MSDDRAWVDRYLATRSEQAFGALYDRHTPVMYRFALRRTGTRDAAENAVQEAWMRAMRALPGFEWRSQLRSWLLGITLNCCREGRAARLRVVESVDSDDRLEWIQERHAARSGGSTPATELRTDLERAVNELPSGAREVLLLHDVEGLTHGEIATALGISAGTSKSQLFRARTLLRRALRHEEASR